MRFGPLDILLLSVVGATGIAAALTVGDVSTATAIGAVAIVAAALFAVVNLAPTVSTSRAPVPEIGPSPLLVVASASRRNPFDREALLAAVAALEREWLPPDERGAGPAGGTVDPRRMSPAKFEEWIETRIDRLERAT